MQANVWRTYAGIPIGLAAAHTALNIISYRQTSPGALRDEQQEDGRQLWHDENTIAALVKFQ
ncbi:hypothetical protein N9383_04525 [Granulosicoccus sp.]|nr:hypothetical protein [Granulosicoccus sp.]